MKLELYYDKHKSDKSEIDKLLSFLQRQKEKGKNITTIDVSSLAENERYEVYLKACTPSVFKKYQIRKVFGSNRRSGIFFGEVPALLVYENEGSYPTDVFPHDKHGKIETIESYLENQS